MFKRLSKLLAFALVAAMMLSILASCGNRDNGSSSEESSQGGGSIINANAAYNAKVVGNDYLDFGSVPIGGGGYVIGMLIHPKDPSVRYIRTDVGGAYRWEPETETWIPITNSFNQATYYGIAGMGLDPNDTNVVYINCGNGYPSDLFKSTDRGETWERTLLLADANGNGTGKLISDSIVVDPHNSNIVYAGTLKEGLFVTYEGAAPKSWQETSLQDLAGSGFIHSICLDPTSVKDGRCQTIYAVVNERGLFRSRDAGQNWEKVQGIPNNVRMIRNDKQGRIYAITPTQFLRLSGNTVTDLTPQVPNRDMTYFGIDYENPNRIAMTFSTMTRDGASSPMQLPIYYTNDGGQTWTDVSGGTRHKMIPWWPSYYFSSSTGALIFEPGNTKSLWFTDWYGVWMTPDVEAATANRHWYSKEKGHEEMVTLGCLPMPTGTRVYFGQADNGTLFVDDFGTYPEYNMSYATSYDYCPAAPNFLAGAGTSSNSTTAKGGVGVIKDTTASPMYFEACAGWDGKTYSAFNVAVCCESPSIMVCLAIDAVPKYTRNMGRTWEDSVGAPKQNYAGNWTSTRMLASDKVKGNVFYYITTRGFYRSDDWGATWQLVNDTVKTPSGASNSNISVYPDKAGHLWVSCGKNSLFYTTDFGATFTEVEGINGMASLGKGKEDGTYSLYVLGTIGTLSKALYRTDDMGATFYRVNDEKHLLAKNSTVYADLRFYGRVYLGSGGCGWCCTSARTE